LRLFFTKYYYDISARSICRHQNFQCGIIEIELNAHLLVLCRERYSIQCTSSDLYANTYQVFSEKTLSCAGTLILSWYSLRYSCASFFVSNLASPLNEPFLSIRLIAFQLPFLLSFFTINISSKDGT
jgi:hypothetical protein